LDAYCPLILPLLALIRGYDPEPTTTGELWATGLGVAPSGGNAASGGGSGGAAAVVVPARVLTKKAKKAKKTKKITPPAVATTAEAPRLFYSTDQRRELRKRKRGIA
jgi:hypothetical protein